VRIIPVGDLIHVYYGELPIRVLTIDPDSYYQPLNGRRKTIPTRPKPVR
jgi:hypothetical protein